MYIKRLQELNAEVIVRYYPPRRYSVRIKKIESDPGTWAIYVYDNKDRQCTFVVWIRKPLL
jgi:hypothetical protein